MSNPEYSRRRFLTQVAGYGALAAAPWGWSQNATGPAKEKSTLGKGLRVAFIGVGGINKRQINDLWGHSCECLCYCDADEARYENAQVLWPKAKGYTDYRRMFEKEAKNFDAVSIGTPDHHHYPATILAMQLGKHVFTQKPLTHTPWEARQLMEAMKKYKVATQMGNQGHANEGNRITVAYLRSGMLGDIVSIDCWTNRPIWPQGYERPANDDPVPKNLNWDAWLGPAPLRPYVSPASFTLGKTPPKPGQPDKQADRGPYHAFNWRGWHDFGCGALGDMACHTMDGIFWGLQPGHPESVELIEAEGKASETFSKQSLVRWNFPARPGRPAFHINWRDGGWKPERPPELAPDAKLPHSGSLVRGTKATLLIEGDYGDSPRIIPEEKRRELGRPERVIEKSPGHVQEWLMACTGQKPVDFPGSNFSYAAPFTELVQLGAIAQKVGGKLEWDGEGLQFKNNPEANRYVNKEYRAGWKFTI